jgi:hypothetical protein
MRTIFWNIKRIYIIDYLRMNYKEVHKSWHQPDAQDNDIYRKANSQ